ncbi:MAG: methionine biosynthesis protein MetW [Pseudomonadota bacterium]
MRADLKIIAGQVQPEWRVLDLGCGSGELLAHLKATKRVNGYGLDFDADNIGACIRAGVNVLEQDLNEGLANFEDDSFDLVVMTETIQAVADPVLMLQEMLRIASNCIVTFPNFGYWRCRAHLALRGRMPMAKHLPNDWHDTPNIHLCTFRDFEALCEDHRLPIAERFVVDADYHASPLMQWLPNLFGLTAYYRLTRDSHGRDAGTDRV